MWRVHVQRFVFGSLLLSALTGTAWAGTAAGTAVTIGGLDNLTATVNTQAKAGAGKAIGILMALGGLATLAAGRPGLGLGGLGGGIAMAFVPNIIGTAFDATAVAPLFAVAPVLDSATAWWAPCSAALYSVLLSLRVLQDPVFLSCLALAAFAVRLWSAARPRALAVR